MIGKRKISPLLLADDLVWLASSESDLQHTLNTVALQLHVTLLE